MPTRPGFVWDATASEWVEIGQAAVVSPFKYQATAPTSPATGDIWIESDIDVPSIDSAQFLRWRKTMTGGETSLSGNDDNSLPLQYTPGYEQLYINGVLMVRGQDYTATTGTTVTGLTALTVNDVVEIFSALTRIVSDVYTQAQADAKYGTIGTSAPFRMAAGSGTTDGSGILAITFPSSRFTVAPILTVTVASTSGSIPATTLSHASVTASGATVFSANSTTGATRASVPVTWIAIQMTSGSGAG
jgi:hypothetical protein